MSAMGYAHPEVLVDTQWVEDHLKDSNVRIAEVDYDPKANYQLGHIPSAVLFDWKQDINDPVNRNVLSRQACDDLLQRAGVYNDTTLVLYGDFNNWFAAFAFWVFKYYGFKDVRIMNGGRKKWLEEDREISKDIPNYPKGNIKTTGPDDNIRVFLDEVKQALDARDRIKILQVKYWLHQNTLQNMHKGEDISLEQKIFPGLKLSMIKTALSSLQTS
jgi:thiosulfate/3-mercaptopyruvate sulfurtransferase